MLRPTTDRTRTRARHRRARGAFLRLEVLALSVVAICLAVLSSSSTPARADLELTSGPGDSLTLSNDKEGAAILSLDEMRPGDSVTDTVTLGNTGTVPGDLSLSTSNLLDTPGAGGGALSGNLDLVLRDITNTGSPLMVFSGKIGALTPFGLGTLAAGASRVYEFRVSFPDAGAGAENAFQGSAVSIQFDWTAVNNDADTDPPETTITAGPASLSASPEATFAFTSDESGSTFECSLDGSAFAACSSPAAYTGLGDGAHTFHVRATDSSPNPDATPAGASWTIDATAPKVWAPSPRPVYAAGLEQAANADPSREHSNVLPDSSEVNAKVASGLAEREAGPAVIVVSGGSVSASLFTAVQSNWMLTAEPWKAFSAPAPASGNETRNSYTREAPAARVPSPNGVKAPILPLKTMSGEPVLVMSRRTRSSLPERAPPPAPGVSSRFEVESERSPGTVPVLPSVTVSVTESPGRISSRLRIAAPSLSFESVRESPGPEVSSRSARAGVEEEERTARQIATTD